MPKNNFRVQDVAVEAWFVALEVKKRALNLEGPSMQFCPRGNKLGGTLAIRAATRAAACQVGSYLRPRRLRLLESRGLRTGATVGSKGMDLSSQYIAGNTWRLRRTLWQHLQSSVLGKASEPGFVYHRNSEPQLSILYRSQNWRRIAKNNSKVTIPNPKSCVCQTPAGNVAKNESRWIPP